jgi:hypothetical protein
MTARTTSNRLRIAGVLFALATLITTCAALPAQAQQPETVIITSGTRYRRPSGGHSQPGDWSRYREPSGGRSRYHVATVTPQATPAATPSASRQTSTQRSNVATRR